MIRQLRPFYTPEELAKVYARPYVHTRWPDHIIRVNTTIHVARYMRDAIGADEGYDFSAGDGAILRACDLKYPVFGDFRADPAAHPDETWYAGMDIEHPAVWYGIHSPGLYICSETLEHMRDPRTLLCHLRNCFRALVLSTPEGEEGNGNPEHYWGWNRDDIRSMLEDAGWAPAIPPVILNPMVPGGYTYQIWGCV